MFYNSLMCNDSKKIKAYYLYGAATFPKYRNKGFMTQTINFANKLALKDGCKYSILLPENDNLSRFYEKRGYQPFFKTNFLKFRFETLKKVSSFEKLCNDKNFENFKDDTTRFNYLNFEKIRERFYNSLYDVYWDADSIKFAVNSNDYYKGKGIKNILREKSYAICCYSKEENVAQILELALSNINDMYELKFLLCNILKLIPAKEYIFRLPVNRLSFLEKFCNDVKTKNWGMIKSLSCERINLLDSENCPYLGLTLD